MPDDNNLGASFGVFPQLKPTRSQQDPEASKDMPLQAMRGMVKTSLGLPADIAQLASDIAGNDTKLPLTSNWWEQKLPYPATSPEGRFASTMGEYSPVNPVMGAVGKGLGMAGKIGLEGLSQLSGSGSGAKTLESQLGAINPKNPYKALPLDLPRATFPDEVLQADADRLIRQMTGEHVTSGKDTENLAGRSKKESERVQGIDYTLKDVAPNTGIKPKPYEPQIGDVNVVIPGDQTISDYILSHLNGEEINSLQQGGAKFGLGKQNLIDPLFWASEEKISQRLQDKITDLADKYNASRIIGQHLAMGPVSNNFAQHFADANMKAIDYSKLRKSDMEDFNQIMREGYFDSVKKRIVQFPEFAGIENPQTALAQMEANPDLRKWFNNRMKVPTVTKPLNLPNGLDVQWAITEPELRNKEVNLTGFSVGEMKPNALLTDTANHNTYSKGIQGKAMEPSGILMTPKIAFPDATKHIMDTKNPSHFTGTIQKIFPHQVVDQQYIDQYHKYMDYIKQRTGKKKGGSIHMSDNPDTQWAETTFKDKKFADGGRVTPQEWIKSLANQPTEPFDPIGNLKSSVQNALSTVGSIPSNIQRLVSNPREYIKNLPTPTMEQMVGAFNPSHIGGVGMAGVIKPKGGNWLNNSVEQGLQGLKTNVLNEEGIRNLGERQGQDVVNGYLEHHNKHVALNNWVDKNLTNYVKKEMGTPEDPIRLMIDNRINEINNKYSKDIAKADRLAERAQSETDARRQANLQRESNTLRAEAENEKELSTKHVAHVPSDQVGINRYRAPQHRETYGGEQLGKSEEAKAWEDATDVAINAPKAKNIKENESLYQANPWIEKLANEDRVYALNNPASYNSEFSGLGFDHVLDVLKENLANGRLKPEDLKNISVEQAVRKTADYNLELAKKMQEAQAKKLDEMTLHKEYPNGMKWVQLDQPGQFAAESQAMGHSVRGYEPPEGHPDWIPESGDSGSLGYGHGGWEAIKSGKAKVYSLVDPKGNPHTTVEVAKPTGSMGWQEIKRAGGDPLAVQNEAKRRMGITPEAERELTKSWDGTERARQQAILDQNMHDIYVEQFGEPPENITQIKGKSNRAPNEQYLPYIQDFVKSGNWSDVGDLQNTGLTKFKNQYLTSEELKPKTQEALNYLNTHPAFEPHRQANREYLDALDKEFSTNEPVYTRHEMNELERRSQQLLHPEFRYTLNEMKAGLSNPEEYDADSLGRNLADIEKLRGIYGDAPAVETPQVPPETPQLKRGGPVHMAGGGKFGALKTMIEEAPEMLPFLKGMFEKGEEGVHNMIKQVMGTPEVKPVKKGDVLVTDRVPALEQASQQIGKTITPEEYANLVEQHLPIRPLNFIPKPPTDEEAMNALNQAKRSKYGLAKDIQEGEKVGARLDIPAYTDKNTWVNSIHQEGKPTTYSTVSHIKNFTIPNFDEKALKVAQGGPKSPFAKMEGDWQHITPEQALDMAKELYSHPEWTQMGMDPRRAGHFYDRYTGQPIVGGEEALQIGPLVFGKNPVYAPKSDFAFRKGGDVHMAGGGSNDIPDIPYNDEPMFRVDPRAFMQRVGDNTFADTSVNIPMKNVEIGAGYNTMNTPTSQMNTPYLQASGDVNGAKLNARYMEPVPNVQRANIMANMPIGTGQLGVGVTNTKDPYQSRLTDAQLNYNIPLGGGRLNAGVNRNLPSKQNQVNLQYVHPFKRGGKVHMSNNPDSQWAELQFKRK